MLSPDWETNLALIGSIPNHGVDQVRIHWLLSLVSPDDFSQLDLLMDRLWR